MSDTIKFTAEVEDMFGNMDLQDKDKGEIMELLVETYNIPEDCFREIKVNDFRIH